MQYDTLGETVRRGYFKFPRRVGLAELADEFEVSEQAVSERVRRATDRILERVLFHGPDENTE